MSRVEKEIRQSIKHIYAAVNASRAKQIRKLIAIAKTHNCKTPISIRKFNDALARIGAEVLCHEKELFGTITPPKRRKAKP